LQARTIWWRTARFATSYVLLTFTNRRATPDLTDLTAVHYPKDELPFEMVWILFSMEGNERLRVKARFADGEDSAHGNRPLGGSQLDGARSL
jgi:NADH:ubiquinone oxidoreductase subunit C